MWTSFNVILALIVVPFSAAYARLVKRLVFKLNETGVRVALQVIKLGYDKPLAELALPTGNEMLEILVGDDNRANDDGHDDKRKL